MNFLTRFLKVFIFALLLSALGALVFYWVVISGSKLRSDISSDEYISAIRKAIAIWTGFITFTSLLLTLTGMKKTIAVPVYEMNTFTQRVSAAITSLRYRLHTQTENQLTFKPRGVAVLAEKITVQLGPNQAAITAPRGLLRKIQERL